MSGVMRTVDVNGKRVSVIAVEEEQEAASVVPYTGTVQQTTIPSDPESGDERRERRESSLTINYPFSGNVYNGGQCCSFAEIVLILLIIGAVIYLWIHKQLPGMTAKNQLSLTDVDVDQLNEDELDKLLGEL